jgi:arabinogalactan endo-1,4-beta-galactosidase
MCSATKFLIFFQVFLIICCNKSNENDLGEDSENLFYLGADLSYVNEMEDCDAVYKDANNNIKDIYQIFDEAGTNLIRFRLWHNPNWTNYSNLQDIKKSIQRAKNRDMKVLLNFHYSDSWADPGTQEIPSAWLSQINNTDSLGQLLYYYTYDILNELNSDGLLPNIVQIGNEINGNILTQGDPFPIEWTRNSKLLNKGIKAVRDINEFLSSEIEVMLHIAQPENGIWWFEEAIQNGVTDFDWIGISYYSAWSQYDFSNLESVLTDLMTKYNKKLMLVETAYPFTLQNFDSAINILDSQAILPNYPPTQLGQLNYLIRLKEIILCAGGSGMVYWEPAWVSTNCNTQWATGSHWENAALFDHQYKATKGLEFYSNSK